MSEKLQGITDHYVAGSHLFCLTPTKTLGDVLCPRTLEMFSRHEHPGCWQETLAPVLWLESCYQNCDNVKRKKREKEKKRGEKRKGEKKGEKRKIYLRCYWQKCSKL